MCDSQPRPEANPPPDVAHPSQKDLLRRNYKLERQVAQLLRQVESLRIKVRSVQAARDQLAERLKTLRSAAPSTDVTESTPKIDPLCFNSQANMDEFYTFQGNLDRYDSALQTSVYQLMLSQLERLVRSEPVSILDAGCGLGILSAMLKDRFPDASVAAFDFSHVAIDTARKNRPDITFFAHDIYDPLDDRFDLVVCTETLEHLLEPDSAVQQLLEATAPSGSLFFTVPDGRIDQSGKHINFWSPESWRQFLVRSGPMCEIETGLIQHPEHKSLRYNWAMLSLSY